MRVARCILPLLGLIVVGVVYGSEGPINLDSIPLPVHQVEPIFKREAIRRCTTGVILVRVNVDTSGIVRHARVVRRDCSCPTLALSRHVEAAAAGAARAWRSQALSTRARRDTGTIVFRFPRPVISK